MSDVANGGYPSAGTPGRPGGRHLKDIAILCEVCSGNGNFDTMWPGGDHDDEPVWGVAEIETDDSGEWVITWLATRLTVEGAEEHLNGLDFGGPVHVMG
jgi:hypothetical protein